MIRTDHEAPKHLLNQKITTAIQQKWLTKLLEFDYSIEYKMDRDNVVVDPLSILSEEAPIHDAFEINAISIIVPKWKVELNSS